MSKQMKCFLMIFGSMVLAFLYSSPTAQATVTNGNIHYYEGSSTESSEASSSSESESSSTKESSSVVQQNTPTQAAPTIKGGTEGSFLKTNDTVNYLFVIVGVIFVLIAVYHLKKT
ncbi:hypothetical protein [Enterococcus sp. LJL51]|uniref:hypothetical protein n=1 Tax=Enterococcus sp. LJL51 TaxID=3416656 RepID=UPI003CFB90A1